MSSPTPASLRANHRASLRGKIVVAVAGTSLCAILVAALALFAHQTFYQRAQFRTDMEALARIVSDYSVAPISFGDEGGMRDALAVLQARPEVIEAELISPEGRILHRFGESETEESTSFQHAENSAYEGWELVVRQPLLYRDENYGNLVIVATYRPAFYDSVHNFLPAVLGLLGLTLVIIGPLTWILAGLLLRGLQRLAASAARIAETGDYEVRAPSAGEDEVGQLTRTFNAMLDKLQIADRGLRATNDALNHEIAERARLEKALVESSRYAGMAEVATGVLHNVGNVLNSVNVSAQLVRERLESSRLATLQRTALLLDPHKEDPSDFYANDPKAKLLPRFLCELHQNLADEHRVIREEMFTLNANIEHIKEVVSAQQSLARSAGVEEKLIAADLLDDAVRIHLTSIKRHEVQFETDYTPDLGFVADRHNTLQILVNLVSNAIHAVKGEPPQNRRVKLRTQRLDARVRFEVADLGVGISEENMTRVFQHGFTTRDDGHGFGLHSGALAAKRMGGSLTVTSAGPHQGATFLLELPLNPSDRLRSSVPHPAAIDSASL